MPALYSRRPARRPGPRPLDPLVLGVLALAGLVLGSTSCTRRATPPEQVVEIAAAPPSRPPASEAKPMIVVPDSPSALLRATHVTLVTVVSVSTGAPVDEGPVQHVPTTLTLELEHLLKGWSLEDPPPTSVTVTARVTRRLVPRIFAVPGAWSEHELTPGARFVLLSSATTHDAATVLSEPQLWAVHAAADAEADVQLAMAAARKGLDLQGTVASIPAAHPVGPLLAEYLTARATREVFYADEASFAGLLELMVRPSITPQGRTILATQLAEPLTIDDPAPAGFRARYVAAAAQLLTMPEAAGLHHNLLSTQLPIVIGLVENASGQVQPIHPDVMFAGHDALRWATEAALVDFPDAAAAHDALEWIQS